MKNLKLASKTAILAIALSAGVMAAAPAHAAKTAAIMVVQDEALPPGATAAQVETAVLQSLSNRGWIIKARAPGSVDATYSRDGKKGFSVTINVAYSAKAMTVTHKESTGLSYDAGSQKIHANYNRWIGNLKADVARLVQNATMGVPAG
jgi:hypothetical protein